MCHDTELSRETVATAVKKKRNKCLHATYWQHPYEMCMKLKELKGFYMIMTLRLKEPEEKSIITHNSGKFIGKKLYVIII